MWCIDNGQAISSDVLMYYVESEQTAMGEYTEHTGFDNLIYHNLANTDMQAPVKDQVQTNQNLCYRRTCWTRNYLQSVVSKP